MAIFLTIAINLLGIIILIINDLLKQNKWLNKIALKGNPIEVFLASMVRLVIFFLIITYIISYVTSDVEQIFLSMISCQITLLPLTAIVLLLVSMFLDKNWSKKHWLNLMIVVIILISAAIYILYNTYHFYIW